MARRHTAQSPRPLLSVLLPLSLLLRAGSAAELDLTAHVPISVSLGPSGASESLPLDGATVTLCLLHWDAYRADPTAFPMFRDLLVRSHCVAGGSAPGQSSSASSAAAAAAAAAAGASLLTVPFAALEREYEARGCGTAARAADRAPGDARNAAAPPGCVPSGMVFHESRCGSTLVANMLAVMPEAVSYSESGPPLELLQAARLSEAQRVRGLRVIAAAMGRPAAVAHAGRAVPFADARWAPARLFFKFQSALTLQLGTFRRAFPDAPWCFVHRNGVEVMASLFRSARAAGERRRS